MRAFVIAAETIKDEAMFAEYRKAVPATIEAFGGKFIARGGDLKLLEGDWKHPRLVIIESTATPSPSLGASSSPSFGRPSSLCAGAAFASLSPGWDASATVAVRSLPSRR